MINEEIISSVIQRETEMTISCNVLFHFNLLTPKSDQHLISPDNITPKSNIRVTRQKEIIMN